MGVEAKVKVVGLYSPERTYSVEKTIEREEISKARAQYHKEFPGADGVVKKVEHLGYNTIADGPPRHITESTGDAVHARVIRAADAEG